MNRPEPSPPPSTASAAQGTSVVADGAPPGAAALAALAAFALGGLVDGLVAYARAPASSRGPALLAWCALHGAGVLAALGLAVAVAQEAFVQAAARRPMLRRLGAWALGGPRRWWAPDERAALALASAIAGVVPAGLAVVAVAAHVTRTFHSRSLMVAPIALAVPVAVALAAVATVVASWPLAPLVRRAGRFASVGAVVTAAAAAALIPLARAVAHHRDALGALDLRGLVLALGVFALDAALVVALLRRVGTARARRRVSGVAVAVTVACAALAAVPALGLGRRQSVLFVLANRTLVTRYAIGPLQRVLDRDRDGYGVLFGGGDCDDRDPRAYPGAPETPGNGVDESCSGRDGPSARTLRRRPRGGALAPRFERSPSVLFVSLDAVRPDRTSAYGYARPTTPNLEHFAGGAARFTSAYAVAPGSLRSFVSTFTGQYPGDVAWGAGSDPRFPSVSDANVTLAESLREAGYATAAFTNTSYFSGTPGFFQGFDVVQDEPAFKDDAAPMIRHAVEWIERPRDRPFFAWVHLIDAHAPYGNHRWPQDFGPSESDRYDGEVARADAFAAPVLAAAERVERRGDPVLVVVFSDHGEGFNEHGARYHYYDVHEESIRVVLLVRGPSVEPGTRQALTALLDLHATVLDLAGRPIDGPSPARSLVPVLFSRHGGTPADWRDEVYSDVAEFGGARPSAMTLIAPPWKILFDAARNGWELYNLSLDPREERNLFDDDPTRATELRARLLDAAVRPARASR